MEENTYTVTLPDIGEGVVEGEVIQWLKKIGDNLAQDEAVVVVMTDKATVELPAPYPGVLAKQYYAEGETAIKGKPLYDLSLSGIAVKKEASPSKENKKERHCSKAEKKALKAPEREVEKSERGPSAAALPSTRKLAKELAIDINVVQGTGKEGRVEVHDLFAARAEEPQQQTSYQSLPNDRREPVIGIRKLMAKKMAESKRKIPHFSYFEQVEAARLVQLKKSFQKAAAAEGVQVTFMPFFIKALSLSLHKFPQINSSYDEATHELIIHAEHNIGIAVTTPLGLIVPVLKNVENLSLEEIVRAYWNLKNKFKENKLLSSDMKGSTITISNFGGLQGSGLWATPIINYPEAAILAIGRVQPQPIIKNGALAISETVNLSWSFDHRIIDGDLAANFSNFFALLLKNPSQML